MNSINLLLNRFGYWSSTITNITDLSEFVYMTQQRRLDEVEETLVEANMQIYSLMADMNVLEATLAELQASKPKPRKAKAPKAKRRG